MFSILLEQPGRLIGLIIILSEIVSIFLLFFVEVSGPTRDVLVFALGALFTKSGQIVSFYFGANEEKKS